MNSFNSLTSFNSSNNLGMNKPLRVAAYCRVSTKKEEQDGSYEMQVDYFTNLIRQNAGMELAGIYGDKGKSGLKTTGRSGLNSLMDACRAGEVDLVLSKSISRFARNMADCVGLLRELQTLGISVFFEKENLDSRDEKSTIILNIFSAIAQEESNSISQNALRSHEQSTLEGRPYGCVSFGYRNAGDNRWEINEEEAPLVRRAFEMASEGKRYIEILDELNRMGTGGNDWKRERLKYLLTNPVYKGDYYSHATVCLVPGKQVRNKGYRDRFYIKGHHEPIISEELFDAVQKIVERGILRSDRPRTEEDLGFLKEVMRHVGN